MASNINITTRDEMLRNAAQQGNINLLYELIEQDPDILERKELIPFVATPLHIAASAGHIKFAIEIMRLKPSFALKLNQQGFCPIHLAMQNSHKQMVLRFIQVNKHLVRVKGRKGLSPLHLASKSGEVGLLANFLWTCPESIKDVTDKRQTALHIAVKFNKFEALQVLVQWLRTRQTAGANQSEKTILNWKDAKGNTILHVFTNTNNDSLQTVQLLVKTGMNLNAKNLQEETALDLAGNAEIKSKLSNAGARHGSSVPDAPTLENELISKKTVIDKIVIRMLRIRRDLTEDQRNALLVVATLVLTATYQSALSPPGGVYQASAGDDNNANSNSTKGNVGKSVMSAVDFCVLSFFNATSLLISSLSVFILIPSGIVGTILRVPTFYLIFSYLYSMMVISPIDLANTTVLLFPSTLLCLLSWLSYAFGKAYKRLQGHVENQQIKISNDIGENN